ncbi:MULTISPECIES: HigA family addiction module antitoxin [unclassified Rhodococcus (in: high G+C Gram-positive bacteria)]|uniref:HigA family addiction module antitoxin n=1 Tax=unclassified Rhodococcus (in: high G+C Gram-positive bacteria) TaxID=192944 RepID=UPI000B9AA804|nr:MULTISPECIES: HigA family addiction module antitoxin [unclassified Rhodococcus (in: high G+C Gram-positive bacteria)]OZE40005.1 addiction module antidote protein, HigA family [Rhodococcus sp. 05-2254-4]OZE49573.1 addiction module antidote protein, HigA family [Rhodococcus sp. 05-2254-3]OZE50211.1 addiction module antidote protein, HigA family [Rhodococcus sp. 05-2254-2]
MRRISNAESDNSNIFAPDWAVPPGDLLAEELRALGMSQTDLAHRTSLSIKHVNQIIKRNVALTADVALALERALGVSARIWLNAEAAWQAHNTALAARDSFSQFQSWLDRFPINAIAAKGIIGIRDDTSTQVDDLLRFFGVTNPAAFDKVWLQPQVNYKRSQANKLDPYSTATWVRLAERAAQKLAINAPVYSARELRTAARELPDFTTMPLLDGFKAARRSLRQAGVMLVFVEPLDKTGLFGISKTLDNGRHMIGLTGRMKALDSFWFAMAHEIAHILLHPKRATFIDTKTSMANDDDDNHEEQANRFASELYLPAPVREKLLLAGPTSVEALAREAGVATAMVAGQYAYLKKAYPQMSKYRPSIGASELRALQTPEF